MIKKIVILLFTGILLVACKQQEPIKDYASLSGRITNTTDNNLVLNGPGFQRELELDSNGVFKDTMKLEEGFYMLAYGDLKTFLFLKNSYDLDLSFDANDAKGSLSFSGLGAGTNNYMADKIRFEEKEKLDDFNAFFELDKPAFDQKVTSLQASMKSLLDNAVDLDSTFLARELQSNDQLIKFLTTNYDAQHEMLTVLGRGRPSPKFAYPDINGKNVSLDDLRGDYVYVDVWATWCGPCKREIPFLKELEHDYENKNITFVGLSIDTQENKEKWKKMVAERDLKGVQVLADKDWDSRFIQDYRITAIPRFILIDPKGNIISHDAPRPSQPELKELFNDLNI
ncbi:MAG: TlpA disulfide reductase family protein [Flavobacteriaceae bacterium]|nr:TlpA disulfide reductase family protein [Flavobacteriaceae bacterium]